MGTNGACPNMGILYSYDISNLHIWAKKGTMRYAQIWSPNLELTLSTVMSQLSTHQPIAHIWACLICGHI